MSDKSLTPGDLSELRSELVNNQFLAVVAGSLGMFDLLEHTSPTLGKTLAHFSQILDKNVDILSCSDYVNVLQFANPEKTDSNNLLFWRNEDMAPKAAGDVLEAIIGAVAVDSQFNMDVIRVFLYRILIDPWWWRFQEASCNPNGIEKHPISKVLEDISKEFGKHFE